MGKIARRLETFICRGHCKTVPKVGRKDRMIDVKKFITGITFALVFVALAGCAANQNAQVASPEEKPGKLDEKIEVPAIAKVPKRAILNTRHAGYYYPVPKSGEFYKARSEKLAQASRVTRLGFVTGITKQQQGRNYPPRFAIFAKGDAAQKLIIIGLDQNTFSSLYRSRAALAQMTAMSRLTPLFKQLGVQDYFTFFDLTKLLGFTDITVSDGVNWAHRIEIR
jgi:hypothetical protein